MRQPSMPQVVERPLSVPGIRLAHGRNVTFRTARTIVHADYSIKLTVRGRGAPIHYRGTDQPPCVRGAINIFEPFEPVHARRSGAATSFISLLVEPCVVGEAVEHLGATRRPDGIISGHVQAALAVEMTALCAELGSGVGRAELEARAVSALERLLDSGADSRIESGAPPAAVVRTRELILDRLAENVPMDALERACGLSRFHLVRLFRQYYRLPPHEFRIQARVALARRLLVGGVSPAAVASEVGFFDQSHLHRHFRRIVGIGPGAFQTAHR